MLTAVWESQYYLSQVDVTKGVLYSASSPHQKLGLSSPYKSFRHVVSQEASHNIKENKKKSSSASNKGNKPKHLLIDLWLLLEGKGGCF